MTLQVAPPAVGTEQDQRTGTQLQSRWLVVAEQECRDLWTSGRGLILVFLFSVLLSGVTYLTSTNQALNFLEQRESVNLVLQFAVAVGVLATLVVSADGISGERERGTLETLLVTPVSRRSISDRRIAIILVEQHTDIALELTAEAIVLERGAVAHRAPSARLMKDTATLERLVGLRVAATA